MLLYIGTKFEVFRFDIFWDKNNCSFFHNDVIPLSIYMKFKNNVGLPYYVIHFHEH